MPRAGSRKPGTPVRVTADRPLTVKQQKFAQAVADGKPKAQAHRENYKSSPPVPKYQLADRRRASELAKQPNVAAEIRRLTWLSMPQMDDVRGMRGQAIRIISDLSRTARSEAIRLQAAMALYKIAETTHAAAAPNATTAEQDRLLGALRGLYRQLQAMAGDHPLPEGFDAAAPLDADDEPIDIRAIAAPSDEATGDAADGGPDELWPGTEEDENEQP